jgi:hypothetical protein
VVLAFVVVVLAGLTVATRSPGAPSLGGPPVSPAALVSPSNAESSSWYCTGQTTGSGPLAGAALILTNTNTRVITGSIMQVSDAGAELTTPISVPARGQLVSAVSPPSSGQWLSESVMLSGGGVAVTQAVQGPDGWSEAPCESSTSQHWYFPIGSTNGSNNMYMALFNPTSTPDVVDLSFVTPAGLTHPINFQGIVLPPGATQVEDVGAFVQNQTTVSTTVAARTGRIVATELQVFSGSAAGLAILAGAPQPERRWAIPLSIEPAGGMSNIAIFNPGPTTEQVTLRARLATGPLAPLTSRVLPDATWILSTSSQTRIPKGDAYSSLIEATGGSGVVVGRGVDAPDGAQSPQVGVTNALDALTFRSPSRLWVVPPPGSAKGPAIAGVIPDHVALANPTGKVERYIVYVMTPSGTRRITSGELSPSAFVSIGNATLFGAGLNPLLVSATSALSVSEDVGPTGTYGVVTMPGIPLG